MVKKNVSKFSGKLNSNGYQNPNNLDFYFFNIANIAIIKIQIILL